MTLIEFLTARLDEDEAAAREVRPNEYLSSRDNSNVAPVDIKGYSTCAITSGRLLREVEAKRAILGMEPEVGTHHALEQALWVAALKVLATVYADHPDHDEDWRS